MEYRCPNCNAQLTLENNIFKCEYCKSSFSATKKDLSVEYIIPFSISKDYAMMQYKKLIKSNILTPKIFKNKKIINKIEGIYVPCYVYDFESNGVVEFESKNDTIWRSGGNKYKKSDIHKVTRGGSVSLERVPVISSNDLNGDIIDAVKPYSYKQLIPFDSSYIKDYRVYNIDKSSEELISIAEVKAKKSFEYEMKKDIKEYKEIKIIDSKINLYNTRKISVLVPIFLLNINYKNKDYIYLINGENGKISGNIPINKKRIIFICLIVFIVIYGLLLLLSWAIL